jgi:AI-2 transport protein TqsA
MKIAIDKVNRWLLSAALLLLLLYIGRPLLVPLGIALMLWGVLNAFAELLRRARCPGWLAWVAAFTSIAASMYLMVFILSTEAAGFAQHIPAYAQRLQSLWSSHRWLQHATPSLNFDSNGGETYATLLREAIGSIGEVLAEVTLIAVYVGFLLAGQHHLPSTLAKLRRTPDGGAAERTARMIGRRIQSYLGVCSLLSVAMGLVTYVLLASLGVDFAGFWAVMMFLLTFIPVVGAVGAALPALMAFLQFGSVGSPLVILLVLSLSHFLLTDVIETIMLGHSLNLSPFVIIVSLTFWGLLWGIAGLFLAVPLTSAFAIVCRNLVGLQWLADVMEGPPRWHFRRSARWGNPRP